MDDPRIAERDVTERVRPQVAQILRSDTFRRSEVLRRLLAFLAEKTISGDGDGLKEYTIATDGLGRPSYDPQQDASVRIQVGRLRQKLAEYYQTEGRRDSTVVELPKGHFKLTWRERPGSVQDASRINTGFRTIWRVALGTATVLLVVTLVTHNVVRTNSTSANPGVSIAWPSPDVGKLWQHFLTRDRPLILAIQDPTFLELDRKANLYRRMIAPDELTRPSSSRTTSSEPSLEGLGTEDFAHNIYYTPIGESEVAFRLGNVLGPKGPNATVVRASELSWKELSDNNVVFAGRGVYFETLLNKLSPHLEFVFGHGGIENLHPLPGEPQTFVDHLSGSSTEQGQMYALVSCVPGPLSNTDVESFMSSHAPGYIGAVESFTDPTLARPMIEELQKASGKMPTYYQVVLKVTFKGYLPVETSFVTYREL